MKKIISLSIAFSMLMSTFTTGVQAEGVASTLTPISKEGVAFRFGLMSDAHLPATNTNYNNTQVNQMNHGFETYATQQIDGLVLNGDMVYQVKK